MKTIKFYKDNTGWYATVDGHTKEQNKMILGADKFLESIDNFTDQDGIVTVECSATRPLKCVAVLKRVYHDFFGAFYTVSGSLADNYGLNGFKVYLCNVVHTVFKKHPKYIYIKSIS